MDLKFSRGKNIFVRGSSIHWHSPPTTSSVSKIRVQEYFCHNYSLGLTFMKFWLLTNPIFDAEKHSAIRKLLSTLLFEIQHVIEKRVWLATPSSLNLKNIAVFTSAFHTIGLEFEVYLNF
jgi:hypothetical protein